MMSRKVWIPAKDAKGSYAFMLEMRDGVRWVLVSADSLSDEQKQKAKEKP